MRITIKSLELRTVSGTSDRGKWEFFVQQGLVHIGDETRRVDLRADKGVPYPVGVYEVSDDSWTTNDRNQLALGRDGVKLKPVAKV